MTTQATREYLERLYEASGAVLEGHGIHVATAHEGCTGGVDLLLAGVIQWLGHDKLWL